MKKIIINTPDEYIYNNIYEYLSNYFNVDFIWLQDFFDANSVHISKEDCVISLYNVKDVHYYSYLQCKMFLILSPLKFKEEINKAIVLTFPVYLPELLNYIKVFINENNNRIVLNIFDYDLVLDYGDGLIKNKKFNKIINITSTEGNILQKLFKNYPNYVAKKDLLHNYGESSALETHIFNIKKKFSESQFELEILRKKEFYKILIKE